MSNYTKSTNFATKDNLSPGDPLKIVRGTEIDTEFNNIATAISTKTDNSAAAITGGSITGITDLAVADGGTGASTAAGALNNLLPSQTSAANKYLQSDGTNASWDAVTLSTADITGTLPVANGGTGVTTSTGTTNVVLSNSPTLVTPALGTPSAAVLTNATGLPISTGVSGLGTGVATFLGTPSSANLASAVSDETGSGALVFANSPTLVTPALGTPSALVGTNITGTASGLTAGNVTTNANLTGAVTSVGNATSLGSFSSANLLGALTDETGTGSAVFATSPTLVTPILGTPTSATLTNATGLPIGTGVSGLGTGVATFLATPSSANLRSALTDETGTGSAVFATSPTLVTPLLGTPTSGVATNLTGLPLTTGVTGTLPTANGGTNLTSFTSGGVVYASSSSALATGSALYFNGTGKLGVGTSTPVNGVSAGFEAVGEIWATTSVSNANQIRLSPSTSGANIINSTYAGSGSYLPLAFNVSGSEVMRLTSSSLYTASGINVGFGTSSPSALAANYTTVDIRGTTGGALRFGNATDSAYMYSDSNETNIATATNKRMIFSINTSEKMRLDTAGNLGLGVTPSPTDGTLKWLQVSGTAIFSGQVGTESMRLGSNWYYNGGFKYQGTGTATTYDQAAGAHIWRTAASGTAGNAISFTQAMTLDADGDLGVGVTSPSARLHVASGDANVALIATSRASGAFIQYNLAASGAGLGYLGASSQFMSTGTSSDFGIRAEANLLFATGGNTERARITSDGNLLVGTTSAIQGGTICSLYDGQTRNGIVLQTTFTSAGTTFIRFVNSAGTAQGAIDANSTTTVAYSTSSDYRLKNTIIPMTGALAKVALLKPVTYKWNVDNSDGEGFIAHELAEVCPYAVVGEKDAVDADGNIKPQGIDTSFLVATLTSALQELNAKFEAYVASHP